MLLSIIVPIYNVERFLPRCLDSLLRQGMESVGGYEIICVNDASPDGCAAILDRYARKHPDLIRVITHQQNQGLGPARNTGVAAARGEYIGFVDSDDYMIDGGYGYICQHFLEGRPDVVHFDNHYIHTDGKTLPYLPFEVGQQMRYIYTDGKTLVDPQAKPEGTLLFDGDGTEAYNRLPLSFVCLKIYKRSFIQAYGIMSKKVFCEDEMFNFEVFRHHPHVRVISSNLYRYEQGNSHSLLHTIQWKRMQKQLDDLLFVNAADMEEYIKEGDGEMLPAARRNINHFLNLFYKKALRLRLPRKEWLRYSKRIKQLPPYRYPYHGGKTAQVDTWLKNMAGRFWLMYITAFYSRRFFLEVLIPLREGKWKK